MSPSLPLKSSEATKNEFENDLIEYLQKYGTPLKEWVELLQLFDFSACKALIIGSVPGYHIGGSLKKWGHKRVSDVLRRVDASENIKETIIMQFSSVGSIDEKWLIDEFGKSLMECKNRVKSKYPKFSMIYPTVENVRTCLEGWEGGNSLPFINKTYLKQQWMKKYMHKWKSAEAKRARAMPHIKSYTRLSEETGKISWFILTSANLSKAAWGTMQKIKTRSPQLMIRSYELGVLVFPELYETGNGQSYSIQNLIPDN
ncbi:tyrosyl-DNA phosphodiesterase 1, partial [Nowakowskiella sp. JEL0078]